MTERADTQSMIRSMLQGVDLAEVFGLTVRGPIAGERHGPCPVCGGDPALADRFWLRWRDGKCMWQCRPNHCDKGGDLIDFLEWRDHLSRGEAIREAERILGKHTARVSAPTIYQATGQEYEDPPGDEWQATIAKVIEAGEAELWADNPQSEAARKWLQARGLTAETLRAFRVGYQGADPGREIAGHWVARGFTLPSVSAGKVWQVRVRRPPKVLKANPELSKYTSIKGSKQGLFNSASLRGARAAILAGGEFDCMAASQELARQGLEGVGVVTFGSEGRKPSVRWLMALAKVARVIVAYDADKAGENGAAKWVAELGDRARLARVPEGKDLTDYHLTGEGKLGAWLAGLVADPPEALAPTPPAECELPAVWRPPADGYARALEAEDLRHRLESETTESLGEAGLLRLIARLAMCEGRSDSAALELHGRSWAELAQEAAPEPARVA